MTHPKSRRKNYFVRKRFQSSFAGRFAALVAVEAALMAFLFFYMSRGTLTTAYLGTELRIERTAAYFFTTVIGISLAVAIAVALTGMVVFVYLSHRIAGPVVHLQKSLEFLRHGDFTYQTRLRTKDEFSELALEVNLVAEFLDARIGDLKREIRRAKSADAAESREALKRLEELANAFKTSP